MAARISVSSIPYGNSKWSAVGNETAPTIPHSIFARWTAFFILGQQDHRNIKLYSVPVQFSCIQMLDTLSASYVQFAIQ